MKTKKILIADDEHDITEFLSYNFRNRGFEVRISANGVEAQDILKEWVPDVIITDILMPEQDGISFCHDLKNIPRTKKIPVIFLSASSDDYHALAAMEAGGAHYISKPVKLEILFNMVESVMADAERNACYQGGNNS